MKTGSCREVVGIGRVKTGSCREVVGNGRAKQGKVVGIGREIVRIGRESRIKIVKIDEIEIQCM